MKINSKLALLSPLILAAGAIAMAMGSAVHAAPVSSGATTGAKCTVTSGKNKGKTGTYTTEEGTGATWCEGSWGGTECTGGGKCKDAAARGIYLPVAPKASTFSFVR
jgi:hypothetical protein